MRVSGSPAMVRASAHSLYLLLLPCFYKQQPTLHSVLRLLFLSLGLIRISSMTSANHHNVNNTNSGSKAFCSTYFLRAGHSSGRCAWINHS